MKKILILLVLVLFLMACDSKPAEITFVSPAATGCIVLCSDEGLESSKASLVNAIKEKCGVTLSEENELTNSDSEPVIMIGITDSSETKDAYSNLSEHEFTIQIKGSSLIVVGYNNELTALAVEYLINNHITDKGLVFPADFCEYYKSEPTYTYATITNPVDPDGGDPWIILDDESGKYYYCYGVGNGVCVREIDNLNDLDYDANARVYTAPAGTMYSSEYWAPELHKINGKWYIYVAADDGKDMNHRMYVLECTGDVPTDPFVMKGKITDSTDTWAIDGTVLQHNGELYFIWSGDDWDADTPHLAQKIYIAHMSNPWTIDSERVLLSKPEHYWEIENYGTPFINEGPTALVKDGTVHIIYSAAGSWSDYYCLGKLTYRGGDVLNPASWEKSDEPVFKMTDTVFGPGHCSFTTAIDGSWWIAYHANQVSGTGWGGRDAWIQPFTWDGDEPVFGEPIGPNVEMQLPTAKAYTIENVVKVEKTQ